MNESRIHDQLRTLAEAGGDPDEDVAWRQITDAIRSDEVRRRRNGLVATGAGIAATAAAIALVASFGGSTDQAVDVGPAGTPTTAPAAPDTSAPTDSSVGAPVSLPADVIAVLSPGFSSVHVLDAVTGDRVSTPIGPLPEGTRVSRPSITTEGTLYAALFHDSDSSTTIVRTRWDGTGELEPVTLPDLPGPLDSYGSPHISPDGRTLAVTVGRSRGDGGVDYSLGLLDVTSGSFRELTWPTASQSYLQAPDEISFSPDSSRLAFLVVHDSDGTEAFDAYVIDVDANSLGEAELLDGGLWDVTFVPGGGILVVAGSPVDDYGTVIRYLEGGPDGIAIGQIDRVDRLQATSGSIVAHSGEAWYRYEAATDSWAPVPYADWAG